MIYLRVRIKFVEVIFFQERFSICVFDKVFFFNYLCELIIQGYVIFENKVLIFYYSSGF